MRNVNETLPTKEHKNERKLKIGYETSCKQSKKIGKKYQRENFKSASSMEHHILLQQGKHGGLIAEKQYMSGRD